MRPEPAGNFRAGVLESAGLLRLLGASGRVIARNLARRPWRATMSIAGIAAAVATVVLGRFTFDAVNHLMAVHFDSAQRDDITVVLREAATEAVVCEIGRLPGVLRAEPFRADRREVQIAHRNSFEAEVVSGLKEGERVVRHPPNELDDGSRVSLRPRI